MPRGRLRISSFGEKTSFAVCPHTPNPTALFYASFVKPATKLYTLSVSAIMAGGIGNMIDRIFVGEVVDFFDFYLIKFAVFNFADCCVCVGAGFLVLALILDLVKEAKAEKEKKNASKG